MPLNAGTTFIALHAWSSTRQDLFSQEGIGLSHQPDTNQNYNITSYDVMSMNAIFANPDISA